MKRRTFLSFLTLPIIAAFYKYKSEQVKVAKITEINSSPGFWDDIPVVGKFNPYRDPDWDIEYEDQWHQKRMNSKYYKSLSEKDEHTRRLDARAAVIEKRMAAVIKKRELAGRPPRELTDENPADERMRFLFNPQSFYGEGVSVWQA
jgi:hypothetical protein